MTQELTLPTFRGYSLLIFVYGFSGPPCMAFPREMLADLLRISTIDASSWCGLLPLCAATVNARILDPGSWLLDPGSWLLDPVPPTRGQDSESGQAGAGRCTPEKDLCRR